MNNRSVHKLSYAKAFLTISRSLPKNINLCDRLAKSLGNIPLAIHSPIVAAKGEGVAPSSFLIEIEAPLPTRR